MSYTEIYKFNKKGDAEFYDEVKNAFRGAMSVWWNLEEKHLPSLPIPSWARTEEQKNNYYSRSSKISFDKNEPHPMKEVWDLVNGDKLTPYEKLAMYTTFDNILVKKEHFKDLIESFNNLDFESSLPEQAKIIEKLLIDDDCIAIGWNQTSVSGDNWANYGGYDEETEENIPYNINNGDKHWFLFE